MKLFSKDKSFVFSALNAIFIIWILISIVAIISNATELIVKDTEYTYDEYKLVMCDFKYDTEETCKNNYTLYKLDNKNLNNSYKRNIIIAASNFILISGVLFFFNKEKK